MERRLAMDSKKIAKAKPGSISHGTMRPEDLIPTFLDKLEGLDACMAARVTFFYRLSHGNIEDWAAWAEDRPDEAVWLLEELFDTLQEYAPEGHYFGAHPRDGPDYGYWRPIG